MQRNGGQEEHVKERVARAMVVMGQVWGIGKRRFGKDYGVEIWGWKERETVESLQERYLRWVLGVERRTPGYWVREELQGEKLRAKAGKRAWAFEERLRRGVGVGWRDCVGRKRWVI
ncbi:hypothetical protein ALC57_05823 [Trachymyrmex cornetzi]|uniref:Uncharacterized protein n=1 Tax=Trachymyrmex cornetzi TaxID=471704 RepID=A0A151J9U9_9HYME|nr:hypothetical protein ALC57_05823 [Trachymyrmex cornetzi]